MLLSNIHSYLRTVTSASRESLRIGPFLATFDRGSTNPYMSYAIPDDGAVPTADDVAGLVAAYADRSRTPRLEYLPALAPDVEPALLAGGFTVEARLPMMVCRPADAVPQPIPDGIEVLVPETDEELTGLVTAQHEAFNQDGPADGAGIRRLLAAGGLAVLARDARTSEPAGAGVATAVHDGTTELAGLGVRERYRRWGIAAAITWELSRLAGRAGVTTAFLTPGGDVAERVYARVGYAGADEMLHISR